MLDSLPKIFRSRKFFSLLGLITILGICKEAVSNNDFSPFIVLLFMGLLASTMSVIFLTKMKNKKG